MSLDTTTDTLYYVISAISMVGSIFVVGSTLYHGTTKSCFTFLIICFHLSLLGEEIATMPDAYTTNRDLCLAMQFFHYYFSLMNILVVTLLVEAHRSSILKDPFQSRVKILKYGAFFIILFPLVSLFVFMDNGYQVSYDDDNSGWCTPPNSTAWSIIFYYAWVWLLLITSVLLFAHSFVKIIKRDKETAKLFSSTIGLYVVISILSWIPRSFQKLFTSGSHHGTVMLFISYLPINVSGILFSLVFLRERRQLFQFSESVEDITNTMSFSWEKDDLLEMMRASGIGRMSEMARISTTTATQNPIIRKSLPPIQDSVFAQGDPNNSTASNELL